MSQFNSLSSFQYDDPSMEHYPDYTPVLSPITSPPSGVLIERPSNTTGLVSTGPQSLMKTDQLQPLSGQLHDVPTTQSLIAALQSTMAPNIIRTPVVIPGSMKRKAAVTKKLPPVRLMSPHLRHSIILGAIVAAVVITTLISLAPLGGGQAPVPLLSGAADWVQAQQQGSDIAGHTFVTLAQANQGTAPVTGPVTNPDPTNLPPMQLSTSQYVAIAQNDATANGISPLYFVRQIQAESGFDPNARSAYAVGIAQFTPSTAAGLGFNPWDPIAALAGAARYMRNLADQYNGDYAKALAAYNAGPGNVISAVAAGGANWRAFLPYETQQYLLKIMG